MTLFRNKVIYLISREEWGEMFFSKHHYAIELGKLGNRVYFISQPDQRKRLPRGKVLIKESGYRNVFLVNSRLYHPIFLREKARKLYILLTGIHVWRIVRKIGVKPDIIWSFDLTYSLPTHYLPKCSTYIYMPVDGPFFEPNEIQAARYATAIFSVTEEILNAYRQLPQPKLFINHGVSEEFVSGEVRTKSNSPLRIGYSGSLLRHDVDRNVLREIVDTNPDKIFEFWGENDFRRSAVHLPEDCDNDTVRGFIHFLKSRPNVILHGVATTKALSEGLKRMDAFLICYDTNLDQSKGTNFHKILEFLATGKVVIANEISTYRNKFPGLVEMTNNRVGKDNLLRLFEDVTGKIEYYNSPELQRKRISFAKSFLYKCQIEKIEKFINSLAEKGS